MTTDGKAFETLEGFRGPETEIPAELLSSGEPGSRDAATRLALLSRVLDAARTGISIADAREPGLPLIYVNRGFSELTGYSAEESLGRNCRFLQGPATSPTASARIREALQAGQDCRVVLKNYRKDGSTFWNELTLTPVRDDAGRLTHFIGIQQDVTARVHAAEMEKTRSSLETTVARRTSELAEALKRLEGRRHFTETVLNSITAGVLTANADGVVTFANRVATETLEVPREECVGSSLRTLFRGVEALSTELAAPHPGPEARLEFTLVGPSGRPVEMGMTLIRVDEPELPEFRFLLLFRDMADRRQYEMEMRRVKGLTALGQMAAGFAHEVRNPLAAMRALSEALLAELPKDAAHTEYVTRILSLVSRVERIVKTSLRFAQPRPPSPGSLSPRTLVAEALEILATRFKGSKEKVRVEVDGEPPNVFVDESQGVDVVMALLENAFESTDDAARVRVRISSVSASRWPSRPAASSAGVVVEVVDDGPGVPAETLSRIFDPFFTTKAKGTGLGLSIAERLVRENGGQLFVTSEPGAETVFSVLLPVAPR